MCGSTSGCGSPYIAPTKSNDSSTSTDNIDKMLDVLIENHQKSIDIISRLRKVIKHSDKKRLAELISKL